MRCGSITFVALVLGALVAFAGLLALALHFYEVGFLWFPPILFTLAVPMVVLRRNSPSWAKGLVPGLAVGGWAACIALGGVISV